MKILNRKQFLETPKETVWSYYEPSVFHDLNIKTSDKKDLDFDFYYDDIVGAIEAGSSEDFSDACDKMEQGESVAMDFECTQREGLFDEKQLFAVYEKEDVEMLIQRLQKSLNPAT